MSDKKVFIVRCQADFYIDLAVRADDEEGAAKAAQGHLYDMSGDGTFGVYGCAYGVLSDDLPPDVKLHGAASLNEPTTTLIGEGGEEYVGWDEEEEEAEDDEGFEWGELKG